MYGVGFVVIVGGYVVVEGDVVLIFVVCYCDGVSDDVLWVGSVGCFL